MNKESTNEMTRLFEECSTTGASELQNVFIPTAGNIIGGIQTRPALGKKKKRRIRRKK